MAQSGSETAGSGARKGPGRPRGPKYPRAVMVMLTEAQGATLEALSWGRKRSMSAVVRHWLDNQALELAEQEVRQREAGDA